MHVFICVGPSFIVSVVSFVSLLVLSSVCFLVVRYSFCYYIVFPPSFVLSVFPRFITALFRFFFLVFVQLFVLLNLLFF